MLRANLLFDFEKNVFNVEKVDEWLMYNIVKPIEKKIFCPKGILFYGPPGNGKSYTAKHLASVLNWNIFSCSSSEFFQKYLGEGEKKLKKVFENANENSPCILFFDEIDALCPNRSLCKDQNFISLTSLFLTMMDKVNDDVIVIGTTNLIENIDFALKRPGRFDFYYYFENPSFSDRINLLKFFLKNQNHNCDFDSISNLMSNYSIADIKLCVDKSKILLLADCEEVLQTHHIQSSLKMECNIPIIFIRMIKNYFPIDTKSILFYGKFSHYISKSLQYGMDSMYIVTKFPVDVKANIFFLERTQLLYSCYTFEFVEFIEFCSLNDKIVIAHEQYECDKIEHFFFKKINTNTLKINNKNFIKFVSDML